MADEITREEQFLSAAAGNEVNLPTPITREEMFLAKAAGVNINITMLDPITRKERYLHALAESGGGGASVKSLEVTENGTYSEEGVAFSPVTVNVPNSYAAADEGKVVSNGVLVAQTAHAEVTENGTIDTTLNNSVLVNVPTGGGGSWTLLGAQDYEVKTTSTSSTVVGTISCGAGAWTSNKIIYVKVRDKAGARNGHFVGNDAFFYNYGAANGATSGLGNMRITIRRDDDGKYGTTPSAGNTGYGVYGFSVNTDGDVSIRSQYNNAYSNIIDGTYRVEVYALDYAPNQGNPFNYSY